jgi:uroporphyrinogen-III synthase
MNAPAPLAGRVIVVTRPHAQCGPLAEAIRAAGGEPLIFPLLEILPADDPAPLAHAVAQRAHYRIAIFISPNAVDHALPALLAAGPWPPGLQPAAVGQGTIKALAAHGITGGIAPSERFDSEALLALPELAEAQVAGQRIAIFRGDGGRELLGDTLRARGASVDLVTCYRRLGPSSGVQPLLTAWENRRLDALTLSSSEGLRHLWDLLPPAGRAALCQTPVFVPHARIAENAKIMGLQKIILTEAADQGILRALHAYNWRS